MATASDRTALPENMLRAGHYKLRVRPTDMALRADGAGEGHPTMTWVKNARVLNAMHYGDTEEYGVQIGEETLIVERKAAIPLQIGQTVDLGINIAAARFYDDREALVSSRRL